MTIVAADWLPYHLPLKTPWQTSRGVLMERSGRLLRLQTESEQTGWGDCAPLPEFGIDECEAISFAEETAHLDLAAQKAGRPLNSWLSDQPPVRDIAVNANLGAIFSINHEAIANAIQNGFEILKIKVGSSHWQDEIAYLRQLSSHLPPGTKLRLDANAAWSQPDAELFLTACNELPVESLEEPLRQPSQPALARLQSIAAYPIAIDESFHLVNAAFFHHPPVRRLILKPARHGGLLKTMEIALRAQTSGIECVVTSSLESNCGLLACAHLAAAIAPQATHGLATADWFTDNTGRSMPLHKGQISLPLTPGLGFFPDKQHDE